MRLKSCYIIIYVLLMVNTSRAQLAKNFSDTPYATQQGVQYGYNRFINKLPFATNDSDVTFLLRGNSAAKRVSLCGSFSNWSAVDMIKTDTGWFAIRTLPAGKHIYKFVIDGQWTVDTDNLVTENDSQGNTNSVYYKPNIVFSVPAFSKTKKVWLVASFNNWRRNDLPLTKTKTGWQIALYLPDGTYGYKFQADHSWYHDAKTGNVNLVITVGKHGQNKDFAFYQNQLALNEETGNDLLVSEALLHLGDTYMAAGDPHNAILYYERAEKLFDKMKNHAGAAQMLMNIAAAYRELSDFPRLLEHIQKAIKKFENAGDKNGLARAFREVGYHNLNTGNFPMAINYFVPSLDIYRQLDSVKETAMLLGDLGHSYLLTGDSVRALSHLLQALAINQSIGNKVGMARNLWILGDYYFVISANTTKALHSLEKSRELYEEAGNKPGLAEVLINLGEVYRHTPDSSLGNSGIPPEEKYSRAIVNQKKALDILREIAPESERIRPLYNLSATFEQMGKLDSAFEYFRQYTWLREKVFSTENQKDIVRLETKYDYEKKEDSLKLQQVLSDERLQKQLMLYQQQQQQLILSNREKDLQGLAYLKTQADLRNEQLIKQQKEKENQLQSTQLKTLTQEKFIDKLNQQKQWTYIIAGFVLLALGFFYFIYRSRLQSVRLETQLVKEKSEQERKDNEFQRKLADVSMSALRSQMNPHFIFNCLNSIKLYTTQNDIVAASEYLTKFSKLIRLVLENSRNEHITLSSELAALQLYIEMEAMRFKEKLSYELVVENNVEASYIEIPPLLLQPYVENAIWHGLMPKDDGGHIRIKVGMQRNEMLEIDIIDNGIGRAAAALNNSKVGKHRSYGMKATTERITLINQVYKTGASVFVHDLVDNEGCAAGTHVTLQIPV